MVNEWDHCLPPNLPRSLSKPVADPEVVAGGEGVANPSPHAFPFPIPAALDAAPFAAFDAAPALGQIGGLEQGCKLRVWGANALSISDSNFET